LRQALGHAENIFEQNFGFRHPASHNIESGTPPGNTGLQAVDYYLWALQRFYERDGECYLQLIWPQVGEIHDLDFIEGGKRGVFYNKNEPLTQTIHKCCRALACSFARNTFLIPQGTFSAASGIHLVDRPYALLRTSSSESVANKCPAQSSRRFMNNAG